MGEYTDKNQLAEIEGQLATERRQFEEREQSFISSLLKKIGELEQQVGQQRKKTVDLVDVIASVLYDFEEIRFTDRVITISQKVVDTLDKVGY